MAAPKKPAEPAAPEKPAPEKPAPEKPAPEKPRILAFFERVGLVKGERYQTVVMTAAAGRSYIGPVVVEDVAAIGNPDDVVPAEIVITFSEPGMKGVLHRVRFSQLVHWSKLPE